MYPNLIQLETRRLSLERELEHLLGAREARAEETRARRYGIMARLRCDGNMARLRRDGIMARLRRDGIVASLRVRGRIAAAVAAAAQRV